MRYMKYTLTQWLLFFFIYCIVGWIYESIEVSIRRHKLVNRGFMRGPMLPIYGSGAVVMLIIGIPLKAYPVAMFFAGIVVCTLLELATGEAMEAIFKVRYWDYTNSFMNFRGHICLVASLAWGFFTLLLNYWIHTPVERAVLNISDSVTELVVMLLLIYFVADFTLSFKTALDLRDILIAMDKIQREVEHMEKRMEVVAAFAQQDKEEIKNMVHARMDERIETAENKLADLKQIIEKNKNASMEKKNEIINEVTEIRIAASVLREKLISDIKERNRMHISVIRNNPNMVSKKYAEALEELKRRY